VKILLEGRPGIGKTTVARSLVDLLRRGDVRVVGFTTEEMRAGGRRVGFAIETVDGHRAVLAHVDLTGPPRVSRYGVDLDAFERIALPALDAGPAQVVVIDELGKMELASEPFGAAVSRLFDMQVAVVATVQLAAHPLTDALKRREDVETIRVRERNRDELPGALARRLTELA
jgi:nucleoside-triphosphatase